ncbi:MAG: peroxiredoxin [Hyphomicrobiaceae bacterium]
MVEEGQAAPDFELATDNGEIVKLSQLHGRKVVVYFYPKDDTSGCTKEAIAYSELADRFTSIDVEVIGISPDSVASHQKFKAKHGLNIRLAADEEKAAAEAYGVWVEKKMYGRTFLGVERSTILIGPDGAIAKVWRKVKVPGHAEAVLETANSLDA